MIAFRWQPDHVDRVLGTGADAVLLAATVIGPFERRDLVLRFETGGPAGFNAQATAGTEFLDNRGKPFEKEFLFHHFSVPCREMKYPFVHT